jgi:hypothetical protein
MSDYLTRLPVELIFKIVENVPLVDILSSVCLVNKRLRSISLMCRRSQLDFGYIDTSMDKSKFDSICRQMVHSTCEVISLTLFNEDDMMATVKNDLFFSRFEIIDKTFPNIRSLTLTCIKYETWRLFKNRLPPLINTLSISLYFSESAHDASDIFNGLLFLSPLLKRLSVKMGNYLKSDFRIRSPNPSIASSVQYLRIEPYAIDILSLIAVAPMFHTLQCGVQSEKLTLAQISPRLLYLQELRIKVRNITWKKMSNLLLSCPRLVSLIVIADNVNTDIADGFEWARILQQIKHFEFKFEFSYHTLREEPLSLDSFRTNFWIKEKKWFVTYDRYFDLNDCSKLYSNSSSIIVRAPHEVFGRLISESTASQPTSFSHVHRLTISDHYLKDSHLYRYTHIKQLDFYEITPTFSTTLKDLMASIDTSQITTCYIGLNRNKTSSFEYIEFLLHLPHLRRLNISLVNLTCFYLHQWPQIVDLKIEHDFYNRSDVLSSNDIDALYHSFPHIKRLDIHSASMLDLAQLLNKWKTILKNLIIRQAHAVSNEQFITRQWIEQNTQLKDFYCISTSDFYNSVKLWF